MGKRRREEKQRERDAKKAKKKEASSGNDKKAETRERLDDPNNVDANRVEVVARKGALKENNQTIDIQKSAIANDTNKVLKKSLNKH